MTIIIGNSTFEFETSQDCERASHIYNSIHKNNPNLSYERKHGLGILAIRIQIQAGRINGKEVHYV